MYLQSCAHGDPQTRDLTALDWTDWLNKIALNEFSAFPPYWLDTIDHNDKKNDMEPVEAHQDALTPNNDDTAYLQTWEPDARLQASESYQKVFHVRKKLGINPH